jgi:hypothetical protein
MIIMINACVYCGKKAQGNYSIHRDGFGVGPEVPLCDGCGSSRRPSCHEIWSMIAMPVDHSFAFHPIEQGA